MVAFNESGQGYWTFEEVVQHEVVEKMVSRFRVDQQGKVREYFFNVFSRHMSAFSKERMLRDYGLKNLVKVEWNKQEKCFHVHYKNGDWWHYTLLGEWY